MSVPFHHAVYPPAPALEIILTNPLSGRRSAYYHAILDTGADITVVPAKMLSQLSLSPMRRERVSGLWGGSSVVKLYVVDVEIAGQTFTGTEVVESPTEKQILIGRNLSNQLRLLIDGPALTVEIIAE